MVLRQSLDQLLVYISIIIFCYNILIQIQGPLASSFAVVAKGWRWTIWEILWVSGAALIVLFFFLPETSSSNILYRKMRRIQKITGDKQITCEPVLEGESLTRKDIIKMLLVTPFTLSFTEPVILFCNL